MTILTLKNTLYRSAEQFVTDAGFGAGSGSIYLDWVKCTGSESDLLDCPTRGLVMLIHKLLPISL